MCFCGQIVQVSLKKQLENNNRANGLIGQKGPSDGGLIGDRWPFYWTDNK